MNADKTFATFCRTATVFTVAGLLLAASLFEPSLAAFESEVTLRFQWTKGETLRYRATNQITAVVSGLPGGATGMSLEQGMTQILRTEVADVAADGTTTLRQSIESLKMDVTLPTGKTTYDTAADPSTDRETPMGKMLSAMIGEPFTVVVLPTGVVQKSEGLARIFEKMSKNAPQDGAGAAMWNMMKSTFNDDSMRPTMPPGLVLFADHPVKPGDTWNSQATTRNPIAGDLTTSLTTTLKALEGSAAEPVATLVTQMTIKRESTAATPFGPLGFEMQVGEGSGQGEVAFDVARGRTTQSTLRTTIPMVMTGRGPDATQFSLTTTVTSTMTVELIHD